VTRGRKPVPTKLKILRGNPGKRRISQNELKPKAERPECPQWLPAGAKAEWKRLLPLLMGPGLLTTLDRASLAALCLAWNEMREATLTIEKEGRFYGTESGYQTPHPAVAMQRSAWQAIKAFSALFGLDPSSRTRLKSNVEKPSEDPFAKFLAGRKSG
jgi:P27 family predicted phage terminase small subunit